MATPSVLTVPSMYGDGILYSGPTAFGPELVNNGTFDTDLTGWSNIINVTWSANFGGSAFMDSSVAESQFRQDLSFQVGKTYEISWEVKENNGCDFFRIYINNSYTNITNPYVGGHSLRFTHTVGNIFILRNGKIGSDITIDNVSVKEITQGSDFEFTRATTGTRINEEGYIEDVPYNFIPYSQDVDNADWDKVGTTVSANEIIAPNNSLTGDKINETGAGTYHNVNHDDKVENGITYTASAYFKAAERTTASIYENFSLGSLQLSSFNLSTGEVDFQNANHIAKISSAGSGWYRCSITFTPDALRTGSLYYAPNNQLTYSGVLNSGVFMWGAQFVKGDKLKDYLPTTDKVNLPRLNYPTYGGCPSLLVEPQRTNLMTYSEDATNWSTQANSVLVTSNQIVSPDGTLNADKLIPANGNVTSNGGRYRSFSSTAGTSYSISVFVKQGEYRYVTFSYGSSSAYGFHFDLQNGVIIQNLDNAQYTPISRQVESFGNGWYKLKLSLIDTQSVTGRFLSVRPANERPTATNNVYATTGDGSSGIYAWGFQIEIGGYTTSYIPTSSSTVTRNEDVAADAGLGTTDTFNDSEGVFYAEIRSDDPEPTAVYTSINDGAGGQNQVRIGYLVGSLYSQIRVAGSAFYALNITQADVTQNNKVAVRYKAGDHAVFLNGFKLSTNTSSDIFAAGTLDRVNFSAFGTSGKFKGENKALAVYKTALTDTELANLTSYNNHDLFIPYRSRMQMIGADQELQCTEHDITRFL